METTPENISDELLIQAKVVHAQLLIKTNTPDLVWEILEIYMVGLEIQTMQAGEYKLLIQLDMEKLFSGKTLTTFQIPQTKRKHYCTIKAMNRHWYRDIVPNSCWARTKTHSMHDYKCTARTEFIWNHTILKYLEYLNIDLWKYVRNGTFAHTWDKSAQIWFNKNLTPDTGTSETISTVCETII